MHALLSGKNALVTGGASGIGRAACLVFAREGAVVCVADRNRAMAEETVERITRAGGRAIAIDVDVADEDSVRAMIDKAISAVGQIDCCFNNAGIGTTETSSKGKLLADLSLSEWQRMIDVNLTGVFLCLKHELLHMRQHGGSIVNMASIGGLIALPGAAAYSASKHGVIGLSKNAATEYAQYGIRVNALCPGHVTTPLLDATDQQLSELAKRNPMKRLGTADEIAEMAAWLCSDRASFTNGSVMLADGGRLAGG